MIFAFRLSNKVCLLTINSEPISFFFLINFSFFKCFDCTMQHVGSQFPNQGLNLCSLQWKHIVLNAEPLGKSLYGSQFFVFQCLGVHASWHMGDQFPNYGLNQYPLQWKGRVLTTGPPEKSGECFFLLKRFLKKTIAYHISYMAFLEYLKTEVGKGNDRVLIKCIFMAHSNLRSQTNLNLCLWLYVYGNKCIWENNYVYPY